MSASQQHQHQMVSEEASMAKMTAASSSASKMAASSSTTSLTRRASFNKYSESQAQVRAAHFISYCIENHPVSNCMHAQ